MGRLLKKKDPGKKKTQKPEKSGETGTNRAGEDARPAKLATVLKKPPVAAKPKVLHDGEPNFIQKSIQFLREVKTELKKVTWPSRKQTMGSTVVVIILVMIISLFLGTVDLSLSSLVRIVLP